MRACVLRDLGDGTGKQYVPVAQAGVLYQGERAFVGEFRFQTERHGPYGSHERSVGLPVGKLEEMSIEQAIANFKN
jgi:hypothetical protein